MKRYDFWSDGNIEIEQNSHGKYVLYEDVINIIKRHEKQNHDEFKGYLKETETKETK